MHALAASGPVRYLARQSLYIGPHMANESPPIKQVGRCPLSPIPFWAGPDRWQAKGCAGMADTSVRSHAHWLEPERLTSVSKRLPYPRSSNAVYQGLGLTLP